MNKIFFLLLISCCYQAAAQLNIDSKLRLDKPLQTHVLTTIREDVFIGKTMSFDSGIVVFKLKTSDVLRFDFSKVSSIYVYRKINKPNKKRRNKNYSDFANLTERNLASPTAFTLARGEWEYSNQLLVLNNVNYGYRDNHTIGVGTMPFPTSLIGWVNLKSSIKIRQNFHAAVGGLMAVGALKGYAYDERNAVFRAIVTYSAFTIGTREKFLNFSVGKALGGNDYDVEFLPWIFSIGGAAKTGARTRFFAELGKLTPDDTAIAGNIGFAVLGKKSNTNLGVLTLYDGEMIPVFSYVRRLGKRT
jgi:hypothetical protein